MIWSDAAPVKSAVGLKVKPFNAVFTADKRPLKTTVVSLAPVPVVIVKPAVVLRLTVPFVAVNVTLIGFALRSTSATEIWFALPLENTFVVSSLVVCGPGTVFTGASFTAVIAMPRVADPPLIPSFAVKVIVRDAVGLSLPF